MNNKIAVIIWNFMVINNEALIFPTNMIGEIRVGATGFGYEI